jgi:hypothetical protein
VEVTLRIKRYNPEIDDKPIYREYTVDAEKNDRVLDALNQVKWHEDGTLTYRRSCAHGICGSDAMRINGRNRLACKVLMGEVGNRVTIEPLLGFSVIKDLVVDMDGFFAGYKSIKPYLITHDENPSAERRQSPADRDRFEDTTKCIPARHVRLPARSPGPTRNSSDPRPSSTRTASSSTAAIRAVASACASSINDLASGAAARSSTAPMPVRGISKSRRRSKK